MDLSPAQQKLLEQLGADVSKGLTTDQASARREDAGQGYNVLDPPIKCPQWVCCLLPCIKSIPSMKAFRQIHCEDAEVLRNGTWIRYDAGSLVHGDIIRLEAGDLVPADCIVLNVFNDIELLVDLRAVTAETKPRSSRGTPTQLFYGGTVVQGTALAIVTAIGANTLVAGLIRDGRFPLKEPIPGTTAGGGYSDAASDEIDNAEAGISLVQHREVA